MMTLEQIRKELKDLRVSVVARETGLHYNTVRDIRDNKDADPKLSTLQALSSYIEARAQ